MSQDRLAAVITVIVFACTGMLAALLASALLFWPD